MTKRKQLLRKIMLKNNPSLNQQEKMTIQQNVLNKVSRGEIDENEIEQVVLLLIAAQMLLPENKSYMHQATQILEHKAIALEGAVPPMLRPALHPQPTTTQRPDTQGLQAANAADNGVETIDIDYELVTDETNAQPAKTGELHLVRAAQYVMAQPAILHQLVDAVEALPLTSAAPQLALPEPEAIPFEPVYSAFKFNAPELVLAQPRQPVLEMAEATPYEMTYEAPRSQVSAPQNSPFFLKNPLMAAPAPNFNDPAFGGLPTGGASSSES